MGKREIRGASVMTGKESSSPLSLFRDASVFGVLSRDPASVARRNQHPGHLNSHASVANVADSPPVPSVLVF